MNTMKTILIDDEPFALEVLKHMLTPYKEINIVGSYTKHIDALKEIKTVEPEIIFLDIEMGPMNGLELAEIFMRELEDVEIVFVTAYSQYAVDAFEINAIDYLLKPVQEKRLSKAISRLKEKKRDKDKYKKSVETLDKLKIYSFGGFKVVDSGSKALPWRTQKSKELFAYLWTRRGRTSSKDTILDAIFQDRELDKASTLLHTTVYQLRKNLEKLGYPNSIVYSEEGYQLDILTTSDLEQLMNIMQQESYSQEDIGEVLKIYIGDFLEEGYHWSIELQQRYRHLVFTMIEKFVKDEVKSERYDLTLKVYIDKLYQIDPFSNSVAEMMINYYGKRNDLLGLETFYKKYKEDLWEEMEVKPTKHILNIYNKYI